MSVETVAEPAACPVKPANLPRPKPIKVNGTTISRAEIARETQNHPASKPVEAWLAAARALVVRELLRQEARRVGIAPEPLTDGEGRRETDEEAATRGLIEEAVVTPKADTAACRRYWEHNRAKFRAPDLYEVRHILIPAPAEAEARAKARETAEALIALLAAEPARFGELAAAHSACPSGRTGGMLGQISRGQTVIEFERALAGLPVGRVAERPVESRYGFHVVVVDRRVDGRELPFELVEEPIARWLDDRVREVAIRQYIGELAGRASIEGIEL